jgi:guanylate kinase
MTERKIKGELIVISGPSGVGKGTICEALAKQDARIRMSVSATTRSPRPGEVNGRHYFFVSRAEFERMIEADELLEYMDVFGMNYYGTPKKYVDEALAEGFDVILEIDVNGAMNVKKKRPDATLIFIAPPSMKALRARLEKRGTETREQIERRYAKARDEMACMPEYDYVVVNDELGSAEADVACILKAGRLRTNRCAKLNEIMKED